MNSLKVTISCKNIVKIMGRWILRKICITYVKTIIQFGNQNYTSSRGDRKAINGKCKSDIPNTNFYIYPKFNQMENGKYAETLK